MCTFHVAGSCLVSQHQTGYVYTDCGKQNNQPYCGTCNCSPDQDPSDHKHKLDNNFDTGTLQLLSVLCIETSHYVCFTRITGSGKDEWVFFDSMAERQGNDIRIIVSVHIINLDGPGYVLYYTMNIRKCPC